jgi:uncharacterized protein YbcV (DUF1398 family)
MSTATDTLSTAQAHAMSIRPKVGGFPVLAEVLHQAGAHRNDWFLPGVQSIYATDLGTVVEQGDPLVQGLLDVPDVDEGSLIRVLRADQAGETSFPEFLNGAWQAGVVSYTVDLDAHTITYRGPGERVYLEPYPAVSLD